MAIARLSVAFATILLLVAGGGCAGVGIKQLRFVEAPYCTLVADGIRYRFHFDPKASEILTTAAARWPQQRVHLSSRTPVEFNCLRAVQEALAKAGKIADYASE